mmetsp:Transcript_18452/g.42387  ORF Transcript_18452/g.42387 Transcript_18452/m.42387 type:complete len:388 (-) Transcript_18452:694-1857(-)
MNGVDSLLGAPEEQVRRGGQQPHGRVPRGRAHGLDGIDELPEAHAVVPEEGPEQCPQRSQVGDELLRPRPEAVPILFQLPRDGAVKGGRDAILDGEVVVAALAFAIAPPFQKGRRALELLHAGANGRDDGALDVLHGGRQVLVEFLHVGSALVLFQLALDGFVEARVEIEVANPQCPERLVDPGKARQEVLGVVGECLDEALVPAFLAGVDPENKGLGRVVVHAIGVSDEHAIDVPGRQRVVQEIHNENARRDAKDATPLVQLLAILSLPGLVGDDYGHHLVGRAPRLEHSRESERLVLVLVVLQSQDQYEGFPRGLDSSGACLFFLLHDGQVALFGVGIEANERRHQVQPSQPVSHDRESVTVVHLPERRGQIRGQEAFRNHRCRL